MTCSALKRVYRDQLREHCPDVEFVHLHGDREVITRRQATRPGHFMPASLLDSQFETLEPLEDDEQGFVVDVDQPVDQIVEAAVAGLDTAPTRGELMFLQPCSSRRWPAPSWSNPSPTAGSWCSPPWSASA